MMEKLLPVILIVLIGCSPSTTPSSSIDPSIRPRNVTVKIKNGDENKVGVYILKGDSTILKRGPRST